MTEREIYLIQEYGQVWNTEQLQQDFEVDHRCPALDAKRRRFYAQTVAGKKEPR